MEYTLVYNALLSHTADKLKEDKSETELKFL